MKVTLFGSFIACLYLLGFAVVAVVSWYGWDYYQLPLMERPHHELHSSLKPGGMIGHGLGIVGSCMILLLFLYSLRKRNIFGLRFGRMNRWLDIHIWFGIIGPLLITLHTAMKFHGIVSISFFSMIAVMLSGFVGRYIYMQIPRDETGLVLSLGDIEKRLTDMREIMVTKYELSRQLTARIATMTAPPGKSAGFATVFICAMHDISRPVLSWKLKRSLRRARPRIPSASIRQIDLLVKRQSTLVRRRSMMGAMNSVFHYWHVFHKPFAIVMIIVMFIHVTVVILMGYKWVF